MKSRPPDTRSFWRQLTVLDWTAFAVAILGSIAGWVIDSSQSLPGSRFLRLLAIAALVYLIYRFWTRWRKDLLWSLRNRLVVAYLFIAVVPIILLLILASLASQIIYQQLAAYLLYEDMEHRISMLEHSTKDVSAALANMPPGISEAEFTRLLERDIREATRKELPGLSVKYQTDPEYFRRVTGPNTNRFAGLLQTGNQLWLVGLTEADTPRGKHLVELRAPVDEKFLEEVAPDLGPIDVTVSQQVEDGSAPSAVQIAGKSYRAVGRIATEKRPLPAPNSWLDPEVDGFSKFDATYLGNGNKTERNHPVFAFFKARQSQLNHRIFASLGEFSGAKLLGLRLIALFFLLIELIALGIGVVLTRAITRTISDLYRATEYVREGNFTHRVRVARKDQLGVLGESFNSMTSSITRLIEEQKNLQKLENEINIASEVQNQLFPLCMPKMSDIELDAICRAARRVSGDYYDFIQLTETHIALAIADISGKGISAALLMASLQAALRSQLLTPGAENMSTAELVTRLNKHLVRNTGDDRFATFFVAIFDSATRKLRYTNAGHLPGFCISAGKPIRMCDGGIVLGIVEDYPYQQGEIDVPPDAVIIGYSDGLVEPENAYGEEFGVNRLEGVAQRVRLAPARKIAESLMAAAEEWSGSPERADDMTVFVAKIK